MAGFFYETSQAITNPLGTIWAAIVAQLPALVAAVIVLIVGCFVGVILGHAVRVILEKLRVDDYVRKAKLTRAVGHTHVPALAGEVFKWFIIILFLQQAVALLNLGAISALLDKFVSWLPNVIIAIIVLLFGLAVANYVQMKTVEFSNQKGMRAASGILKWVIIIMILMIALNQIGIDIGIVESTFLLLIGGLALGVALALGIGLGLGLRKESEDLVKEIKKHF